MTREDIIRMAQESSGVEFPASMDGVKIGMSIEHLECFANLVAAAERERIKWETIHSCHPECDKPVCVAIRAAVAEEREACAKVCETLRLFHCEDIGYSELPYKECAFNIRERGAPALERLNKAAEDSGEPL
jgi:hypothetical protein